jgi:hypothetical protein
MDSVSTLFTATKIALLPSRPISVSLPSCSHCARDRAVPSALRDGSFGTRQTAPEGVAGKVSTLHRWMKEALNTGTHAIVRFVRSLKQDMEALEAAVSQPWSNGPVEGQINRLKMLKRQMYGTELLCARLLPDPIAA